MWSVCTLRIVFTEKGTNPVGKKSTIYPQRILLISIVVLKLSEWSLQKIKSWQEEATLEYCSSSVVKGLLQNRGIIESAPEFFSKKKEIIVAQNM